MKRLIWYGIEFPLRVVFLGPLIALAYVGDKANGLADWIDRIAPSVRE